MFSKIDLSTFNAELSIVCSYLTAELQDIPEVFSACLIGSRLEPEAFTRFSDTDLIVFTRNSSYTEFWADWIAVQREKVPGLILHLENPSGLENRAPLLVYRLLSEHIHLCGFPPSNFLKLPPSQLLRTQGVFRAQEIVGTLQMQLSEHRSQVFESLRDAWILRKFLVEMLRYYYLIQGPAETSLSAIIHRALQDESLPGDIQALLTELHQTAAESTPAQVTSQEVRAWYRQSLEYVRILQASIISSST